VFIERIHNKMLEQEITSTLSENLNIQASVKAIVPIMQIYDSPDYEKKVMEQIVNEFISQNRNQQMFIEIHDDHNKLIFSNANQKLPEEREELDGLQSQEIRYILRDICERTLLFTANLIDVQNKAYLFTYTKDVTPLYEEKMDQYRFFIQMDIIACLLYMLIMFVVSKGLTRPIEKLIQTVKVITQGDFTERVKLKTRDEVGVLGGHFNRMADTVENTIKELELHNSEKDRFIQNFTHEIKTPLTSIIGYANYLRVTKYNEEALVDGLNVISSEAKRLESLSFKLMDLILLRDDYFEMETGDLKKVIDDITPSLKIKAMPKGMEIVTECESCKLELETDLIKLLLTNLVDNAIQASPEHSAIMIKAFNKQEKIHLEVIDQGTGIPEKHLGNIFEPFYMVDKARTRKHNGAGLGLSICQSVASLHHAIIEAESEAGRGSTLRVIFDSHRQRKEEQQ
jgi:signal transduction histidine kinase